MAFYSNISKVVLEPMYQIVAMYSTREAERLISEYDVNLDRLPDYWVQRRFLANTEFNLRVYKGTELFIPIFLSKTLFY